MTTPTWLDRRRAGGLLAGVLGLLAWGLVVTLGGPATPSPEPPADGYSDVDLYREIVARVAAGADYYTTAIATQLAHNYPTTPFVVVRLPTLTWLRVLLGDVGSTVLLVGLAATALVTMMVRLRATGMGRWEWAVAVLLLGLNLSLNALGVVGWFHEAWAGVLIVIAIALRTDRRWWPAVLLGFAACCFRELALPFLLVMAVLSWRRRREFWAWVGAIVAFALVYALHALAVLAVPQADPVSSNGWLQLGGWGFVLATVSTGTVLSSLPLVVTAVVVPLALFGWVFGTGPARAVLATCAAFMLVFWFVGRPENSYWGLLYAPLLVPGLALAPRGLAATVRALRPPPS